MLLDKYAEKLQEQRATYHQYLTDQIWSSLPELEKKILGNTKPDEVNSSNRDSLLRSLKYSNSSVTREDVLLVEREIEQASSFILIAYNLGDQLKEALASQRSPERQSSPKRSVERSQAAEKPTDSKESRLNEAMSAVIKPEDKLSKGERVIARNDLLGYYYMGKISKLVDSRHVNVKLDGGGGGSLQENMSTRYILKLNNRVHVTYGDYVLAQVINELNESCFVPGIIQTINQLSNPKLYRVMYFNGQDGENSRNEIVKINKTTFSFTVNYIKTRLGLK